MPIPQDSQEAAERTRSQTALLELWLCGRAAEARVLLEALLTVSRASPAARPPGSQMLPP